MAPVATKNGSKAPEIVIKRPNIEVVRIHIEGTSPLICHRWSEKAKKKMRDKEMQKPKQAREPKDPERDYEDSLYRLEDGSGYGFPSVAFKAAIIRAGKQVGMVMADLRTWLNVRGELTRIEGEPHMREDVVGVRTGTEMRYRGQFDEWKAYPEIEFNESNLKVDQLVSLLASAGFGVGIGEWRPEKGGLYGRFRVTTVDDLPYDDGVIS